MHGCIEIGKTLHLGCSHHLIKRHFFVFDLGLRQSVLDNVVFQNDPFDFGTTSTIRQIVAHDFSRLLVIGRKFLDTGANLLRFCLELCLLNQLRHQKTQFDATLGFSRKGICGNRHFVGIWHATLGQFSASSLNARLTLALDQ